VQRGRLVYNEGVGSAVGCTNCHGPEPADMIQKIQLGTTVAGLAASYNVGQMRSFQYQTALTAANNADLAAFIKSRVMP
jgi:cytochrome c553